MLMPLAANPATINFTYPAGFPHPCAVIESPRNATFSPDFTRTSAAAAFTSARSTDAKTTVNSRIAGRKACGSMLILSPKEASAYQLEH